MKIVRASEKYLASYTAAFDAVAREGKFLSISKGYTSGEMAEFIRGCRQCGYPEFFLINGSEQAVGWCDIVRRAACPDDVGYLGIGILRDYRGAGWGTRLMDAAIRDARKRGFNEIRLEVRASNYNAIRTYRRFGFVKTAYTRNGVVTDGVAEDVWTMSYLARRVESPYFNRADFFSRFPSVRYKFVKERKG